MSKRKAKQYRRSPRISEMERCEQLQSQPEGPACRSGARKRPKLKPLHDVAENPHKVEDNVEDHLSQSELTTSRVPEKRILELILDILQRRDTHEIFAEPVNPDEVEGYHEIIKEPMDFGTMRAKLHEGMYTSLEQFEHDVFLIPGNAMYFNSSTTIYFRQARAINELAKRVFHALKENPNGFETEITQVRRRNGRRVQIEARGLLNSPSPRVSEARKSKKVQTETKGSSNSPSLILTESRKSCRADAVESSKTPLCLANAPSNLGNGIRQQNWDFNCPLTKTVRDSEEVYDAHDVVGVSLDRDCHPMYATVKSYPCASDTPRKTIFDHSQQLVHNCTDFSYGESLMLFVKDLGVTAKRVAKSKLCGWPSNMSLSTNASFNSLPSSRSPLDLSANNTAQSRPSTLDAFTSTLKSSALSGCDRIHENKTSGTEFYDTTTTDGNEGIFINGFPKNSPSVDAAGPELREETNDSRKMKSVAEIMHLSGVNQLDSYSSGAKGHNLLDGRFKNVSSIHRRMALVHIDDSRRDLPGSRTTYRTWWDANSDQPKALRCSDPSAREILTSNHQSQQASKFAFDLPFLRTRLDELNASGDRVSSHHSGVENQLQGRKYPP